MRQFLLTILIAGVLEMAVSPTSAATFIVQDHKLLCDGQAVLENLPDGFSVVADLTGAGAFLKWTAAKPGAILEMPAGKISGLKRFTSVRRDEPFWMLPAVGTSHAQVQAETQWLLAETTAGRCVMLVPLLDGPLVFTLSGDDAGLRLHAETGDPAVMGAGGAAMFVSVGDDPHAMTESGAAAVMAHLGTGKLRKDKPVPDFVDAFGWCTWDSFYKEVSADKVRTGLESFKAGGVEPRFMILDDGWQDYEKKPGGEERLISLNANQARFGGDLSATVRLAKSQFKVRTFLVWHAFNGYWGGVDGNALPGYGVRDVARSFGPGILKHQPLMNQRWWGRVAGVVAPDRIAQFYNDYHDRIAAAGVDGVKVDNQAVLEGTSAGNGGRVAMSRAYRKALEDSVAAHFKGRLINCMANAMENYYFSPNSTLMRTSIDFWPKKPETHGQHLYTNAQVGMWFGQFMQPDWDMFQSAHAMGPFHAAGRAVSGGPVYVSDTPDAHNFDVLRKLVLSDGSILRAGGIGLPTRDCLFADVTREPVLLKIFNRNSDCAVIGAFNANYHANASQRVSIAGTVSPADAHGLGGEQFVGYAHNAGRIWRCGKSDAQAVSLAEGEWELVTFAPVDRGVAVLGLADKLNSSAAVTSKKWLDDARLEIGLRDGGKLLAWAQKPPGSIQAGGVAVPFAYDPATGRVSADVPVAGAQSVVIRW